ncbi:MAG TPA: flavodoxin [Chloroflexi bacterium]|nr:flavodoxin [Chloroflexota bacterium]
MSLKVLITYATRFGATMQVADAIAKTAREAGQEVELKAMKDVHSLEGYQGVFLGSAVNYATWLPEAVEFVKTMQEDLRQIAVVLFTVHITNVGDDEKSRRNRQAFTEEVRELIDPVDEAFFAGKFDRQAAGEIMPKWLAWLVPTIDLRKWQKIRVWTTQALEKIENHLTL